MNIKSFGKATKQAVEDFEKQMGFLLEEDYKEFLTKYNGGTQRVRYSTFSVEDLSEEIPLDVLFGLVDDDDFDLRDWNDEYKEDLLPNTIIIGRDPGSGFIVLINNNKDKGVYYWDHSLNFSQSNEEQNVYWITDSFQTFIGGLKDPK
ncbi:SMI1/KNR4 family protein [Clostridium sp.]|uniref:SMI1/KNR4 family protein n=1 Tax=Clostridium sp. TaxID=1506 RepID=UPI002635D9BD|nr:SMI1/KNR4 family protein [Clostridium sp.]